MIGSAEAFSLWELSMKQILFYFLLLLLSVSAQARVIHPLIPEAIYGIDNRQFITSKSPENVKRLSQSVAMIVSRDSLVKNFLSTKITASFLSDTKGINLCSEEKFAAHHSLSSCTGFLVSDDLMVSAGHCFMNESDCSNKIIAFDVYLKNERDDGYKVYSQNIYECSQIVSQKYNADEKIDFAVIKLNRKVAGRKPLKLRNAGSISSDEKVFMIGHPLGMPQVFSKNAKISESSDSHSFKATLNSFEGNSGSPVFNSKTLEVEGILVRGEEDFEEDPILKCNRYLVYDQIDKAEGINRIEDILPLININQ